MLTLVLPTSSLPTPYPPTGHLPTYPTAGRAPLLRPTMSHRDKAGHQSHRNSALGAYQSKRGVFQSGGSTEAGAVTNLWSSEDGAEFVAGKSMFIFDWDAVFHPKTWVQDVEEKGEAASQVLHLLPGVADTLSLLVEWAASATSNGGGGGKLHEGKTAVQGVSICLLRDGK